MHWKTALYLRLSRDDGQEGASESIKNQRSFLERYANENNLIVEKVYADDGYSGTTFERPSFKQMIQDIESGKINCVITKDLSRLGRDYIMTGHYLERYFPEHDVRYIAVTDGFDTFSTIANNDMSPFKAVFNDLYAKDISKKVRTAIATKREQGKFIGAISPYGYKKDAADKNHLVVDEDTAVIVREIFSMALAGLPLLSIANQLSAEGIKTPSQYKGLKSTQQRWSGVWNDGMIKRILTNETYIGNLVQNRTRKVNYKVNKKLVLPPSEWVIVEGTHEPIVKTDDFKQVQQLLQQKKYDYQKRKGTPHLLSGIVYCADCNSPMSFIKESDTRSYLVCSTWRKHASLHLCSSHCIRESIVEEAIKEKLREITKQFSNVEDLLSIQRYDFLDEKKELNQCTVRLKTVNRTLLALYKDRAAGIVPEKNYIAFSTELNHEGECLSNRIEQLNEKIENGGNHELMSKFLADFLTFQELDRALLITLVKRILIGNDKEITIEFNFSSFVEK